MRNLTYSNTTFLLHFLLRYLRTKNSNTVSTMYDILPKAICKYIFNEKLTGFFCIFSEIARIDAFDLRQTCKHIIKWTMFNHIMIVVIINIFVLCKNILNLTMMWWYENKKYMADIRPYWNCFCFTSDYETNTKNLRANQEGFALQQSLSQECVMLRYTCALRHFLIHIRIKWRKPSFMDFNISFLFFRQ